MMKQMLIAGILCAGAGPLAGQVTPRRASVEGILYAISSWSGAQRLINGEQVPVKETGVLAGVRVGARFGFVSLEVTALAGSMDSELDPQAAERSPKVSAVSLWLHPMPWLALGAEADAWSSTQFRLGVRRDVVWRRFGAGARIKAHFGIDGLEEKLEFMLYPVSSAVGERQFVNLVFHDDQAAETTHRAEVGISYAPPTIPISIALGYRVDRFVFQAGCPSASFFVGCDVTGLERNQMVRGLIVRAGLRIGR